MSQFVVDFRCTNCGNEWIREFESGKRIRDTGIGGRVTVYKSPKVGSDIFVGYIECPVCEIEEDVLIDDRNPI